MVWEKLRRRFSFAGIFRYHFFESAAWLFAIGQCLLGVYTWAICMLPSSGPHETPVDSLWRKLEAVGQQIDSTNENKWPVNTWDKCVYFGPNAISHTFYIVFQMAIRRGTWVVGNWATEPHNVWKILHVHMCTNESVQISIYFEST